MAISLLEAIKNGDQDAAKRILIQKLYSNIDRQSSRKDGTPLFWCCCRGYMELARLILLHGADVNRRTAWGASPLHAGADHNQPDVIKLLVDFGANVNLQTTNGDTACHLAAYRGYKECVYRLVQLGADVNVRNQKHQTAVQEAYSRGHYDIYSYLLRCQTLVTKPSLSSTAEQRNFVPVGKPLIPKQILSENNRRESSRSTDSTTSEMSSFSLPSRASLDYSLLSEYETKSNRPILCDGRINKGVVGVLRLNYFGLDSQFSSDRSPVSSLGASSLNDLSSVNSKSTTVPPRTLMSFNNI
ncbi:hypothetical protein DPMN_120950 [Dreissena polymorpha]|uniref:Uncharacterized protein n=2 Tax=Dreissena polymorpha TaxID=45954 RepID=A0A9D4JP28_DREPO|nr:hypothetical protein DPMN_120950 [Dreissena polymorpha]